MNDILIPPIKSKGLFAVDNSFSGYIRNDIEYTVVAIRTIQEVIADGINVLDTIYTPHGLTETDYNNDVSNNIPIITLMDEAENYYYIPANRILSIPKHTGHLFIQRAIVANMGMMPIDLDISYILNEIRDYIKERTGIEPDMKIVDVSQPMVYDDIEYETYENTRNNNINNRETCVGRTIQLTNIINELKRRCQLLADKVLALENP